MAGRDKEALSNKIKDMEQRFKSAQIKPSSPLSLGAPRSRPSLTGLGKPGTPPQNRPRMDFGSKRRQTPETGRPWDGMIVSTLPDSKEIEAKYQEIMQLAGVLDFGGDIGKIQCKQTDLEDMGELGHGTCGQVFTMLHKQTGKIMAVKQMRRSGNREENKRIIMDLETVLKSHSCPYIVHCYGIFITESEVWICMELMSTCLDKLMKKTGSPIPEKIIGKITVAVLSALNYLKEEHGVIHRDVKPSNILLDEDGSVKLCDFGISGRLVDSKAQTRTGTACAGYMAPERIQPPDPQKPDYDIRADVWSLGVTLVELAAGEFPYNNCKTDFEVLSSVLTSDPPKLPINQQFDELFVDFINRCLTKDVLKRPKYKKLIEHPFIKHYQAADVDIAAWYRSIKPAADNSTTSSSPIDNEGSTATTPTPSEH